MASARDWLQRVWHRYRSAPTLPTLAFLAVASPAIYIASLVRRYGMSIPLWDDWGVAPMIAHAHTGELRFAELYEQQLEARVFLPKLILILFTFSGRYDARDGMMLSVLLCCLTAIGVWLLLRGSGLSPRVRTLCFVLIALGIFSPAQEELWLLASGFPSFLPALFIIIGLVVLQTKLSTSAKFLACCALAIVSTFTLAHGLLAWALTFPIFLLWHTPRRWKIWLAGWSALGALAAIAYFWGYAKPPETPPFAPAVPLLAYAQYIAAFLGGTLAYGLRSSAMLVPLGVATLCGIILVALFVTAAGYISFRRQDYGLTRRALPWVALGCYSIASAVMASLGRVGLGVQQALESRYVTFSLYLTVAIIVLAPIIAADIRRRSRRPAWSLTVVRVGCVFIACAYLILYVASFDTSVTLLKERSVRYRLGQAAVLFSHMLDTSRVIKWANCPRPEFARQYADVLDRLGLLRPPLIREMRVDSPALEVADGDPALGRCDRVAADGAGMYRIAGWAALTSESRPADCVFLSYETPDRKWIPVSISSSPRQRPDVVDLLQDEDQLWSGWVAHVSSASLPPSAKLSAWAFDHENRKLYRLPGQIAWRGNSFELLAFAASPGGARLASLRSLNRY